LPRKYRYALARLVIPPPGKLTRALTSLERQTFFKRRGIVNVEKRIVGVRPVVAALAGSLLPLALGVFAERFGLAPMMWLITLSPLALVLALPRETKDRAA
jgi:hypothetical protein